MSLHGKFLKNTPKEHFRCERPLKKSLGIGLKIIGFVQIRDKV